MSYHRDEQKFRWFVSTELEAGRIPGPTSINTFMGWNGGHRIQRSWATALRIILFRKAGLIMNMARGRWEFPK